MSESHNKDCALTKLDKQLDELVRDLTSVVPRSKSEVRQRIQALLDQQKKELLKKLTLDQFDTGIDNEEFADGYDQAITDLEALKKTL